MNALTQLLAQSDELQLVEKKKCYRCSKIKTTRDFNKKLSSKDGLGSWCRECQRENNNKIMNSEIGMVRDTINGVFNRPVKKSNKRKKKWIPEISRKGVWQIILNHVCIMKEKFPGSDGRLCFYCHQPWTYIRGKTDGSGKKGPNIYTLTNFSLDRFDCRFTYKNGNIVCCCLGCNNRKGSSIPGDWPMFMEAENEFQSWG